MMFSFLLFKPGFEFFIDDIIYVTVISCSQGTLEITYKLNRINQLRAQLFLLLIQLIKFNQSIVDFLDKFGFIVIKRVNILRKIILNHIVNLSLRSNIINPFLIWFQRWWRIIMTWNHI